MMNVTGQPSGLPLSVPSLAKKAASSPQQGSSGLAGDSLTEALSQLGRSQVLFGAKNSRPANSANTREVKKPATRAVKVGEESSLTFHSVNSLKPDQVKTIPGVTDQMAKKMANILNHRRVKNAILMSEDKALSAGILKALPEHKDDLSEKDILTLTLTNKADDKFWADVQQYVKNRRNKERPLVLAFQIPAGKKIYESTFKEIAEVTRNAPEFANVHLVFTGPVDSYGHKMDKQHEVGNFKIEKVSGGLKVQLAVMEPEIQDISRHWKVSLDRDVLEYFANILTEEEGDEGGAEWLLDQIEELASFANPDRKHHRSVDLEQVSEYLLTRDIDIEDGDDAGGPAKATTAAASKGFFTVHAPGSLKTNLSKVVGHQDAKDALNLVIKAAKYPAAYRRVHEGNPKAVNNSVLLYGPKGNGKTEMARALAGEINAGFIAATGNFANTFVGGGAMNIRDLEKEIINMPYDTVVVFLDEIDAMGKRNAGGKNSNSEDNKIVNQFLSFMDGFKDLPPNKKVIVVAATNNVSNLDDAVLDRFVHKIKVNKLTAEQRRELLGRLLENIPLASDVELDKLAERATDFNGRTIWQFAKRVRDEAIFDNLTLEQLDRIEKDPASYDEVLSQMAPLTQQQLTKILDEVIDEDKNMASRIKQEEDGTVDGKDSKDPNWRPKIGFMANI